MHNIKMDKSWFSRENYQFQCTVCKGFCESKVILEKHMKRFHPTDDNKNLKFPLRKRLYPHILKWHDVTRNSSVFFAKKRRRNPIVKKFGFLEYILPESVKYDSLGTATEAVRAIDKAITNVTQCNKRYIKEITERKQFIAQHKNKPRTEYECDFCHECFRSKREIYVHMKATHGVISDPKYDSMRESQFDVEFPDYLNNLAEPQIKHGRSIFEAANSTINRKEKMLNRLMEENSRLAKACAKLKKLILRIEKRTNSRFQHFRNVAYKCGVCNMNFTSMDDVEEHINLKHPADKVASFPTVVPTGGDMDMKDVGKPPPSSSIRDDTFRCGICEMSFTSMTEIAEHITIKHDERLPEFKCKVCPVNFGSQQELTDHVNQSHVVLVMTEQGTQSFFYCQFCQNMFTTLRILKGHIRRDHGEAALGGVPDPLEPCQYCQKFYRSSTLGKHINAFHREIPPYIRTNNQIGTDSLISCEYCTRSFKNEAQLNRHTSVYHRPACESTDLRDRFQCDFCPASFTIKTGVSRHLKRLHGVVDMPFLAWGMHCPLCPKTFNKHPPLVAHCQNEHQINMEVSELEFQSLDEFHNWKSQEERNGKFSTFKKCQKKYPSNIYYICNRTGCVPNKNRKTVKYVGSMKLGSTCPMRMELKILDNTFKVVYFKTHVGHDLDCLTLLKKDERVLITMLKSGMSTTQILEELRNSDSPEHVRIRSLKSYDLVTIIRKYRLFGKGRVITPGQGWTVKKKKAKEKRRKLKDSKSTLPNASSDQGRVELVADLDKDPENLVYSWEPAHQEVVDCSQVVESVEYLEYLQPIEGFGAAQYLEVPLSDNYTNIAGSSTSEINTFESIGENLKQIAQQSMSVLNKWDSWTSEQKKRFEKAFLKLAQEIDGAEKTVSEN